jgi:hypothetical protein
LPSILKSLEKTVLKSLWQSYWLTLGCQSSNLSKFSSGSSEYDSASEINMKLKRKFPQKAALIISEQPPDLGQRCLTWGGGGEVEAVIPDRAHPGARSSERKGILGSFRYVM